MIQYAALLKHHNTFDLFWKQVLERLSIADAPFFSVIKDGVLFINENENEGICLDQEPEQVIEYCRQNWDIPRPLTQWKDIKKESTRNRLLRKYADRVAGAESPVLFMKLQVLLSEKVLSADSILIENGEIIDIAGSWG